MGKEMECPMTQKESGWFTFQRKEGYPTQYPAQFTSASVDVLIVGLILVFLVSAVCFYIILPAFNLSRRRCVFLQITLSLFTGGVILIGNFGHAWEVGSVRIKSPYKPGTGEECVADLTLHVFLRGINITLTGEPAEGIHSKDLRYETIDYNEHFSWEWNQGTFGFGKYAGRFSREFRAAIIRGLPLPILQVAEYFTFDGEGIRFGRHFRQAGWYAHIFMWTAFAMWIVTNILFCMVVRNGALFFMLTGVLQLVAIGIWTFLRNPTELSIPFESPYKFPNGKAMDEVILQTKFGSTYYTVLFNGGLCVALGLVILILDMFIPDTMCQFFGIDPLSIYEEYVLTAAELKKEQDSQRKHGGGGSSGGIDKMEKGGVDPPVFDINDEEMKVFGSGPESEDNATVHKRRPSSRIGHQIKQSFRRKPNILPRKPRPDHDETQGVRYQKPNSVTIQEENEPLLKKQTLEVPQMIPVIPEDETIPIYDNLPELRKHKWK